MKLVLYLITIIAAIVLISFGVNNINQPSNQQVWLGVAEVILAIILLYFPLKTLIKKI